MAEYIEREAVLEAMCKYCCEYDSEDTECICNERLGVLKIPAADVAPVRHGEWLPTTKWWQGGSAWKQCSECGILHLGKSNFCPNCGCMMDLED